MSVESRGLLVLPGVKYGCSEFHPMAGTGWKGERITALKRSEMLRHPSGNTSLDLSRLGGVEWPHPGRGHQALLESSFIATIDEACSSES